MSRSTISSVFRHLIINFFVLIILAPIAWVLILSVKSLPDAYTGRLWPEQFDFSHYGYVLTRIQTLPTNMANSLVVTFGVVAITSFCAVLAGYALVHLRTPGKAAVIGLLTATLFFPTRLLSLIPIYEIQRAAGFINHAYALILPLVTLNLALSVLTMRGVFEQIPGEMVEAAKIDGCNAWQTLLKIMLPLVKNGLVVLIIVNFVSAWGEYLISATMVNDVSQRTMPVVLASAFGGNGAFAWPRIAAVYVMVITPGIIAFALAQRLYFKGLTEGAIKM